MCRLEEEKILPSFDLVNWYPNLKETVTELLAGNASFHKLEPFNASPHVIERFLHTMSTSTRKLTPKLVFHGTMTGNFPNIQKHGLIVPGRSGLPIVNGNAYGSGIYLSTCPVTSLSYVRDHPQLLVCALLEGDMTKVTSHGVIRVAKDAAYVLPCYILHYKGNTPSNSSGFQRFMSNPYFHTFLFSLITLFKLFILLIGITVICYMVSLSCMGYAYFMDRPINEICYEVNTRIWNSYTYIFYSIIFYGIYNIILWPLFYLIVGIYWIITSLLRLVSWMFFWICYYGIAFIFSTNKIALVLCSLALLGILMIYDLRYKKDHQNYNRIRKKK